jgi:glutathione peroxidase
MPTLYDFRARSLEGEERSLGDYRGRVALVVNVASRCGLTPHYAGLQALYERLHERGLEVLGFPCNQFAGQEPGSEEEIRSFCSTRYGVTFPLFSKIDVNGPGRHPLYAWLTTEPTSPDGPGDVQWNFAKFLIDREGRAAARFAPQTDPAAPELAAAIERALDAG